MEIITTIFSIGEPLQCSSLNEYNPLWKDRWKYYGEDGKKYEYINYDDYKNNTPLNVANKQEDKDNEVQSQLPKCKIVDQKVITKTACYGTITYSSNAKYVGEFNYGTLHGQGTFTFANGDKYVGEFKWGTENGQGTYIYANGDKYVGEFNYYKKHGQGTYTYADGRILSGEWKYNKFVKESDITPPEENKKLTIEPFSKPEF